MASRTSKLSMSFRNFHRSLLKFSRCSRRTATTILSAVQSAIKAHSATTVTLVGHSLGAFVNLTDKELRSFLPEFLQ